VSFEGYFKSRDGLDFYERRWDASGELRANVVLIHGYGEHCSRYAHVANALNARGITVHTFDQRGYGHSPGKRAYIHDFNDLLLDLDTYLDHVRPRLEGLPWFLMGHSMGGLLLARYAETRIIEARGLVFSSPFLAFPDNVPRFLLALAGFLSTIAPWLPVGGVDNSGLSRDPAVVEAADNDPLAFHGRVAARTGAQFNKAIQEAHAEFARITTPVYIVHGSNDQVVSNRGTRALCECCGAEDKYFKLYDGGYHELWNDLEKEAMIAAVGDWILEHCRTRKGD